jgi:hypothetical protein
MTWLSEHRPMSALPVECDPDRVTIDKNIPMPGRKAGGRPQAGTGAATSYPWQEMERGDSFKARPHHSRHAIQAAANWHGGRLNRDFSVREMPDGTTRVWRTR